MFFFHGRNTCPVSNAQLVRVIAQVGFAIVSTLVYENSGMSVG